MMTFARTMASVAIALAVGVGLVVNAARADTVTQTTSVGLVRNAGGQECAIGLVAGSGFAFGRATWNVATRSYELANGGVKEVAIKVINTASSRACRVDVRGAALGIGADAIPIHDLKLEEGANSAVDVETVPQVPDQEVPEIPAWLIVNAADGECAIVRATLSSRNIAGEPVGAYTGLLTLTSSAIAP
jgi:hypothetical protein